jgi:enoyl-CoA hydratase/carnithine racemase
VPRGEALPAALEWAAQIATRPREAVRYSKIALRVGRHPELASSLHGLVSDLCHNEKSYRSSTEAFRR